MDRQSLRLFYGDPVRVAGSWREAGGRMVYMAGDIRSGDHSIRLRDEQGTPLWNPDEVGKY